MRFGYFDDSSREYVIETPQTPYPWINYLGNESFFGLISNTSGGYCFYRDARLRRVTRYRYNNIPVDNGGRYFYINDGGDIWTNGWMPVRKDLDAYECRHGLGYTKIRGERNGISVSQLSMIPLKYNGEVHQITIKNNNDKEKNIKLFSFVEWCLWNAYDDMTNFQRNFSTGEVEVDGSAIYHKTEYRERRNHYAFYWANTPVDGFDTDRESFIGLYNGFDCPKAVLAGKATNSIASGWQPVASHYFDLTLKAGEEKTIIFVLGYVENPQEEKWEALNVINKKPAQKMQEAFKTTEQVNKALSDLKAYWDNLLSIYNVESNDDRLNRMVNIWNPYQCMVTFNMSRSASYFESGIGRGMGFRDSNQDILGFVHQIPERARERILDIAATQFEDGGCYHQYQPLTKKGNHDIGGGFNDDPLWLILAVSAYIKETGDYSILDEQVPFDCNPNNTATLLEHLTRSFYHVPNNLGPHGLPLIGRADWNDCLRLGKKGESTFVAFQLYYAMSVIRDIAVDRKDTEYLAYLDKVQTELKNTINENCWEGDRFIRGFKEDGQVIGSKKDPEASMWVNPQSWAVISGLATKEQAELALESVHRELNTKYGVRTMAPSYVDHAFDGALAILFNPSTKENGGIFSQPQGWIILAEALMGHGNRAYEYFSECCPANMNDHAEIRVIEPYAHGQFTEANESPFFGRSHTHWLTGTASTVMVGSVEGILGMRPDLDGLTVAPSIPSQWKELTIEKTFRGKKLNIRISNPNGAESGYKEFYVNGEKLEKNYLPESMMKDVNDILLIM